MLVPIVTVHDNEISFEHIETKKYFKGKKIVYVEIVADNVTSPIKQTIIVHAEWNYAKKTLQQHCN